VPGTTLSYETFLERIHPDDRERVRKTITTTIEKQIPFRHDERIVRPDGKIRILDSQGDVEADKNGKVKALFGFCRDVTEERFTQSALKEREERFAKIFHASPVATILTGLENNRTLDVNQRFLEITGYRREELIGNNSSSLSLWEDPTEQNRFISDLRKNKSLREVRLRFHHRNGYQLHLIASIELIEIGGIDCMLCLVWRD